METPGQADGAAGERVDRVTDAATNAIGVAKEEVSAQLREGAEKLESSTHRGAEKLREAANGLEGENAWLNTLLLKSADGIDAAAGALKNGNIDQATAQLSAFARREPAMFIGGCVAIGYLLSRVGKTAMESSSSSYEV